MAAKDKNKIIDIGGDPRSGSRTNLLQLLYECNGEDDIFILKGKLESICSWRVATKNPARMKELIVLAVVFSITGKQEILNNVNAEKEIGKSIMPLDFLNDSTHGLVKWIHNAVLPLRIYSTNNNSERRTEGGDDAEQSKPLESAEEKPPKEKKSKHTHEKKTKKKDSPDKKEKKGKKRHRTHSSTTGKVSKRRTLAPKPRTFNITDHFATDTVVTPVQLQKRYGSQVKYIKLAEVNLSETMYLIGNQQAEELMNLHSIHQLSKENSNIVAEYLNREVDFEETHNRSRELKDRLPALNSLTSEERLMLKTEWASFENNLRNNQDKDEAFWQRCFVASDGKILNSDTKDGEDVEVEEDGKSVKLICQQKNPLILPLDDKTWTELYPDYGYMANAQTPSDDMRLLILFEFKRFHGTGTHDTTNQVFLEQAFFYALHTLKKRMHGLPSADPEIFQIYGVAEAGPFKGIFHIKPRDGMKPLITVLFRGKVESELDLAAYWVALKKAKLHARSIAGKLRALLIAKFPNENNLARKN